MTPSTLVVVTNSHDIVRFYVVRYLGRSKEMLTNVHATYPVTRKPEGVKMGQGKGSIDHFVARVPAGKLEREVFFCQLALRLCPVALSCWQFHEPLFFKFVVFSLLNCFCGR